MCSHRIYDQSVPNPDNFTPIQRFRLDADLWQRFGDAVGNRRRSALIGEFIRWYLRVPSAKLPARPALADSAADQPLPPEIHEIKDGRTASNPQGRTWYIMLVESRDDLVQDLLNRAGRASGYTLEELGPQTRIATASRVTALRLHDALMDAGCQFITEEANP